MEASKDDDDTDLMAYEGVAIRNHGCDVQGEGRIVLAGLRRDKGRREVEGRSQWTEERRLRKKTRD
ncbi:hypothetical protein PRIPAC_95358 [Pristionchus pacificus]|uniref:Uncharacterized protein n=1 Tax=Pristionchus pacificus TaxID=54126 RepID=A0A2A6BIU4_PRIPA|nr:hypothetical protein PRIPAC_95358 [Pristionchus pacificus]|eukprot:PDM65822.1 hypothetical protein PRIPAC_45223 [Pristionchus pacificus]